MIFPIILMSLYWHIHGCQLFVGLCLLLTWLLHHWVLGLIISLDWVIRFLVRFVMEDWSGFALPRLDGSAELFVKSFLSILPRHSLALVVRIGSTTWRLRLFCKVGITIGVNGGCSQSFTWLLLGRGLLNELRLLGVNFLSIEVSLAIIGRGFGCMRLFTWWNPRCYSILHQMERSLSEIIYQCRLVLL